ncbi:FAD-binding oxidoreductase [Paracoccus liaowanqingii]|uniref:FAD-binding oxidoreductase n=1 Tax=Paracoccus liaowanqingii TaxID=2560053 RepID=A0A4Z1CGU5_9RHOB|nr:FAD-binding oxidoreductase [Paracoccus liaowanqingii]TGN59359.1 FAD-binding oxidoreductase [Paracoccus liaowanqingii]
MRDDPCSHGLWERTAPAAPRTGVLEGETTAEVAIVGAGYTGLSTALHLAERGIDAVVLEAVEIGFGGAGRNVGLVNAGMWVMPDQLVATLGADQGGRLIALLAEGPARVWDIVRRHGIDCEATPTGTLHTAVGPSGWAEVSERARQWQRLGAPVELLPPDAAAAMIGSKVYAGALLDRRAGTIQPLAYARGLARAALGQGARIFTGSPATGLQRQGTLWRVTTPAGSVTARRVVMATDAYTRHLAPQIRTQQVFLPYFNLATEPLPDDVARTILPGRQGGWDTQEVLTSFRLDRQNRMVFGSVGALRNSGDLVHRAWARRALRRIFPQIGEVKFQTGWFGQIGMTGDNLPRFHRLDEGIYSFCGYNGRGIAPGTAFGQVLAGYLAGEIPEADLPLRPCQPQPAAFGRLRAAGFEIGAQMVHLVDARR